MKKFFTFLAVMGIISSSFAQWSSGSDRGRPYDNRNSYSSSAIVVNTFSEKRFTVMIDNMQYQLNGSYGNSRRDNMISIPSLAPGRHTITVFESRAGFFGRQRQKDVYRSTMFLKPGMQTTLSINNYGQVNVSESRLYQNGGYGRDDRRDDRDDRRDNDDRGRWDDRDGGHH